jgi:hypothetical protein
VVSAGVDAEVMGLLTDGICGTEAELEPIYLVRIDGILIEDPDVQ